MRKVIAACTVAFVFMAAPASAQTFGFGAHAGVSLPTGDYGDAAKTGFSAGLDLTYPLLAVTPGLNWYTSVDVAAHSAESDAVDGGFLFVPIMTGLKFEFPAGALRPFINGQLGLVLHQGPDVGTFESEMGTDFGFVIGGGARFGQNFYAGVKYYPLSPSFKYEGVESDEDSDVNFLDIYIGFGAF